MTAAARTVPRWRCKGCKADFSITSGTIFASRKLPLSVYLAAIAIFCNEVKGKSMLALSRDLGVQYKTSFVLAHKLREAMASDMKGKVVGGEGAVAEIDGGYFGGYLKPANIREVRVDRRFKKNQTGKRQCVVVIRERGGRTLPSVFPSESSAINFIRSRIKEGTIVHADESSAWNTLHSSYEMFRINHQEAYSRDGACTNVGESYFSPLRRAEAGHHHHMAGVYLLRFALEAAWCEDHRRLSTGEQLHAVGSLAMRTKPSVDFMGYWQRNED